MCIVPTSQEKSVMPKAETRDTAPANPSPRIAPPGGAQAQEIIRVDSEQGRMALALPSCPLRVAEVPTCVFAPDRENRS
jgi:hypothetical protein